MNADTFTIFLMNMVVSATLAVLVGVLSSKDEKDGLLLWAFGLVLATVSFFLLSLRSENENNILFLLGPSMLQVIMTGLFVESLYQYYEKNTPRFKIWLIVSLACLSYFFTIQNQSLRTVINSIYFVFFTGWMIILIYDNRKKVIGKGHSILMFGLVLIFLDMFYRAIATMMHPPMLNVLDNSHVQAISLLPVSIALGTVSIGIVLMSQDKITTKLQIMALQDELTMLPNRRSIFITLDKYLAFAIRNNNDLTVIGLDIDFFKKINDTHGHDGGDIVLKCFAKTLSNQLRSHDILGRVGGEEFLIIAPGINAEGAIILGERLRETIEKQIFVINKNTTIKVTVSIGIFSCIPNPNQLADELLKNADDALYKAKHSGRNCVVSYTPKISSSK